MTEDDKRYLRTLATHYGVSQAGMLRLLLRTAYENLPAPGVLRGQKNTQERTKTHG